MVLSQILLKGKVPKGWAKINAIQCMYQCVMSYYNLGPVYLLVRWLLIDLLVKVFPNLSQNRAS